MKVITKKTIQKDQKLAEKQFQELKSLAEQQSRGHRTANLERYLVSGKLNPNNIDDLNRLLNATAKLR